MNRFLEVLRKSLFVPLQAALDEAADQIPAGLPVFTAVTIDFFVDGKAPVELKIENGFRLFSG